MRLQKIVYGPGSTTLTPALPARPWVPGTEGVAAGREWSAAGIPAAWVTRRDRTLEIPMRLLEAEWAAFRAFLDHAQAEGSFQWFPNAALAGFYTCYLVSPSIEEKVKPARGEYFGELDITITIRRVDGNAIDEAYFG